MPHAKVRKMKPQSEKWIRTSVRIEVARYFDFMNQMGRLRIKIDNRKASLSAWVNSVMEKQLRTWREK